MKIVAFVGETFELHEGSYYAKPTSAAFLQDTIGNDSVFVCSPSKKAEAKPTSYSTVVDESHFYPFPSYSSTKDFAIKSIFNRNYIKQYKATADKVIAEHSGAYFWLRTPSIGSIIFGLQALKAGEKVLHHMCANASNTWRDPKYTLPEKVFGFLFSRYLRFKLSQICKHDNTINLCTGDVLESFSRKYSPKNTHQFVDLMAKRPQLNSEGKVDNSGILNLLFVGRIVEDKGVFDLISVVEQLQDKVKLTIIGDGPDLEIAQQKVKALNLEDNIQFTGQLPHQALSEYFDRASVIVVPSNNHYEGFPRVIMEGWAHKKPVIVSQVGGVKAFVKNAENGLIFTPGNQSELLMAIESLLNDSELLNTLENGAEKMAKYSNQAYWVEYLKNILEEDTREA